VGAPEIRKEGGIGVDGATEIGLTKSYC
jgi:hypothetical protein